MRQRNRKNQLSKEEKDKSVEKRKQQSFKRKIRFTFIESGFTYLRTEGKHFHIGNRVVELDYVFIYENIIIICEDTCSKKKDKEHIRKKSEAFREIKENMETLLDWIKNSFPDKRSMIDRYRIERYHIFYFYFSQAEIDLTDDEKCIYNNINFITPETLAYFNRMAQCIHFSARNEVFRYLKVTNDMIGYSSSEGVKTTIKAPIIYPQDATGLRNGIRVVSFMMSADTLLNTAYVLRKDNWEDSIFLYQRLIEKEKIRSIRAFLAKKGEAFYNNIIVALPDNIKFEGDDGKNIEANELGDFQHCTLIIPNEMNSICVIDGQHRIFAHYEGPINDKYEEKIRELRKQLHLLVTGLIFPKNMKEAERKQIQSEIFLDINDNTKKVAANVLTHIEMIRNPFSDIGLARRVIEKLNGKRVFLNKFELSSLDENKIKVSSIIKFALRYLVAIQLHEGKTSLYAWWEGDKKSLEIYDDENMLSEYIEFCAKVLDVYFSAVKSVFSKEWHDPDSKLLSVISINGFIIAFNRQLSKNGVNDFDYYNRCIKKLSVSFARNGFPYTSSQYHKFSDQILKEAFDFSESDLNDN